MTSRPRRARANLEFAQRRQRRNSPPRENVTDSNFFPTCDKPPQFSFQFVSSFSSFSTNCDTGCVANSASNRGSAYTHTPSMFNVVFTIFPDQLTRKSIRPLLLPKQNSTRYPLELEFCACPWEKSWTKFFVNVEIRAFDDRSMRNERHRPN